MGYGLYFRGEWKDETKFLPLFWTLLALLSASCGGKAYASCHAGSCFHAPPPSSPPRPRISRFPPQICKCVLRFDHISIEQGLSQSSVWVIFQDSRGFLWFGTEDGLNRYDGYTFKTYKPDPDVPSSLSDRWITSITEDKDGYLWIATRAGWFESI